MAPRERTGAVSSQFTIVARPSNGQTLGIHAYGHRAPRAGTLPPMVLVHGFGISGRYLLPLAQRLAPHADVFVPELPGHGHSDRDTRPLGIRNMADLLLAWLDANRLRRAVLVGHSLGCQIVAEAARDGAASAIVLIGPTLEPSRRRSLLRLARHTARTVIFEHPGLVLRAAIDYARAGPRVLLAELGAMRRHRLEDVLPHINVPCAVIRGARDRIAPGDWAQSVARGLGAEIVTVARWGHAVHFGDPDAVARVVLETAQRAALHSD